MNSLITDTPKKPGMRRVTCYTIYTLLLVLFTVSCTIPLQIMRQPDLPPADTYQSDMPVETKEPQDGTSQPKASEAISDVTAADKRSVSFPVSLGTNTYQLNGCSFAANDLSGCLTITPSFTDSGLGQIVRYKIEVALNDDTVLSAFFDEYEGYINGSFFLADLLGDGTDQIVLTFTWHSNYPTSVVHVLKVADNQLKEILTVIDCPADQGLVNNGVYDQSLFVIPEPTDNFGLPDTETERLASFCTGAYPTKVSVDGMEKQGIAIMHLESKYSDYWPCSVLAWNGSEWVVAKQSFINSN